jgi:hypothetical protein
MAAGAILRLLPYLIQGVNSPYRGGGLFAEFALQISAAGYRLPEMIPFYSEGGIPYAYPPLPFYTLALARDLLPVSDIALSNLLPPLIAIVSLPVFHRMTLELLLPPAARLGALVAWAAMPVAFFEHVDGEGLSESWGALALLVFVLFLSRAFTTRSLRDHVLAGVAMGVCVLAGPGSAISTVPIFGIFTAAKLVQWNRDRSRWTEIGPLLLTGAISVVIASPYLITVAFNHGIGVFTDSVAAEHNEFDSHSVKTLKEYATLRYKRGRLEVPWNLMLVAGAGWALLRRRWDLVLAFVMLRIVPREGAWLAGIPASVLAGAGLGEVFGSLLRRIRDDRVRRVAVALGVAGFGAYAVYFPVVRHIDNVYTYERTDWTHELEAMRWVDDNLPEGALLVGFTEKDLLDWLPHYVRRTVLNAEFGTEWTPDRRPALLRFNRLLSECTSTRCIEQLMRGGAGPGDVYLFARKPLLKRLEGGRTPEQAGFDAVWQNRAVFIGRLPRAE